jgi:DNA repair protein RadA
MMDSPYHPYSDTRFTVTEKGADDIEEQTPKKGSKRSTVATTASKKKGEEEGEEEGQDQQE